MFQKPVQVDLSSHVPGLSALVLPNTPSFVLDAMNAARLEVGLEGDADPSKTLAHAREVCALAVVGFDGAEGVSWPPFDVCGLPGTQHKVLAQREHILSHLPFAAVLALFGEVCNRLHLTDGEKKE